MNRGVKGNHPPLVRKDAVISADEQYRYELTRNWGSDISPYVLWVMLNPSTADASVDDPTIRRCHGFTFAWGFSKFVVVNLFALRSPDPKALLKATDPVGPTNDQHISRAAKAAALIVCAWGAHPMARSRGLLVQNRLPFPMCLGKTKDGYPKHPLYVPAETKVSLL